MIKVYKNYNNDDYITLMLINTNIINTNIINIIKN